MPPLPPFRALPGPARYFVVAVIAGSLLMIGLTEAFRPITISELPPLLYIAVGTQIAALLPIRWRTGVQSWLDPLLIAAGLVSPGAGPGLLAWLATFDGRVPGRDTTWWIVLFNRAMLATAYVLPSLAASQIHLADPFAIPVRTLAYVAMSLTLNYVLAARALSLASRSPFWSMLAQNVAGFSTLISTATLGLSGGILYLLLRIPGEIGYFMAPALFGFILAVRSNVADAQHQAELKDQVLSLMARSLDLSDPYTENHSQRVGELAGHLAEQLELSGRECELYRTAGQLHDLGKIGMPDDILLKPGPLTPDEWQVMRRHPEIGADMIAKYSDLADVAPAVRSHHERWDGSGYPDGLKGDAIPLGARILSVADSFDTITGTRLYRRSVMTWIEGVEDISQKAGIWYDPEVVDALRAYHDLAPMELLERPAGPRRLATWRVLRSNPGFARLGAAIAVSGLGDPLTQVAALVSIYAVSRDARAVALVFIAQAAGTILMSAALGGIADRFHRRRLIVSLEFARAFLLVATPFLLMWSVWIVVPVLFALAAINAIVSPARQAAIPGLVLSGQVGRATAIVTATMTACGAIGYGLAGIILASAQFIHVASPITVLFIADAATFAAAALLILGIRDLGGGEVRMRMTGSLRRAFSVTDARPHLVIGTIAAFLSAMSFPALLALAYHISPSRGGQIYSSFEVLVLGGIFVGSVLVTRAKFIGSMWLAGVGLLVAGIFSFVMAISPLMLLVGAALFIASIGNPVFVIANTTAVTEAAEESNRGAMMASRLSLVQTASIVGIAAGGFVTYAFNAMAAYGVLATGLILVGMFAIAAGGRVVQGPAGRRAREMSHGTLDATEIPRNGTLNGQGHKESTGVASGAQTEPK